MNEKVVGLLSLLLTVFSIIISFTVPEVRNFFGLKDTPVQEPVKSENTRPDAMATSDNYARDKDESTESNRLASSCLISGLKGLKTTVLVQVQLNGKNALSYSQMLTNILKQRSRELASIQELEFTTEQVHTTSPVVRLNAILTVQCIATDKAAPNANLNQAGLFTGILNGEYILNGGPLSNGKIACPFSGRLAGTERETIEHDLIETTFKNN